MDTYSFKGKWITNDEFFNLPPRNVFHRQLDKTKIDCAERRNKHILFRKSLKVTDKINNAKIYISADDYYKLYINGRFVAQGPSSAYHFRYNYNVIDVSDFIRGGENVIAVHTLYQGLINRVWQSGDNRHGLILDLYINDRLAIYSDESFLTHEHSAYKEIGTTGYDTAFLEEYDSRSPEVGFEKPDFNDTGWTNAKFSNYADYSLTEQKTKMLDFENIYPISSKRKGDVLFYDFGANYVGYLYLKAKGREGEKIVIRAGQELNEDGSVKFNLRANCRYEETWILDDGYNLLDQFDYKSFRYIEVTLPNGCLVTDVYLIARHYPFNLRAKLKNEYTKNFELLKIWNLCVNTQKYGVQEAVLDCMEREKGFYIGDGCYTALAHMMLTNDDTMVKKLIDDSFSSEFITDGLVTCLNCSFMQEIAEYPLMLVKLALWHYRYTNDKEYLRINYSKIVNLLEVYRCNYEKDHLLCNLDKWCVVEWPPNFRDGYDVDILEGKVCEEPHVSINAYYVEAVRVANKIAKELSLQPYREEKPLVSAFYNAFYDKNKRLFKDGTNTDHVSMIGNIFPFAFGLYSDDEFKENVLKSISERKISSVSLFGAFPLLEGLVRCGREDLIAETLLDEGAWLRMIKEGATTTFEGWGKDTKWNTSLFHLTMSYAAVFMVEADLSKLFE